MPDGVKSSNSFASTTLLILAIAKTSLSINANNLSSCLVNKFKLPMWLTIDWTASSKSCTCLVSNAIVSSPLMNWSTKSSTPNVPITLTISAIWPKSSLKSLLLKSFKYDTS